MMKKFASNCFKAIKWLVDKIRFRIKLRRMDDIWRITGGGCFDDYPPSFYYTHTPEEARRIRQEEIAQLKAMLEEYCEKNGLEKPNWNKKSGEKYEAGKENICDCQ